MRKFIFNSRSKHRLRGVPFILKRKLCTRSRAQSLHEYVLQSGPLKVTERYPTVVSLLFNAHSIAFCHYRIPSSKRASLDLERWGLATYPIVICPSVLLVTRRRNFILEIHFHREKGRKKKQKKI